MIVVTGASGHIGNNLVRALLEKKEQVRVLVSPKKDLRAFEGLEVEMIEGDILDEKSLEKAFAGAEAVFHLAGLIKIQSGKEGELEKINLEGTKNVLSACLNKKVKRLVYVSSVEVFTPDASEKIITEKTAINPDKLSRGYARSKALATLEVIEAANKKGVDAVIVCPSAVIGPNDFKPSALGKAIIDYSLCHIQPYIKGAYDFVDVRDVARAMIAAWHKGRKGEIYLLTGEKMEVKDVFVYLKEITKNNPFHVKIPTMIAKAAVPFSAVYCRVTKQKPLITSQVMEILQSNSHFDNAKAKQELDFTPRPAKESIYDTVLWLNENMNIL